MRRLLVNHRFFKGYHMKRQPLGLLVKAALVGAAATMPSLASAAGFSLTEQSVTGLGRAFAGGAALAEDATTIYYNPAGLTRLNERSELIAGASLIRLGADFDKTTAIDAIGQPLSGGEGGDVGKLGGVPILYYTKPLNDRTVFGIGFNAPFGLATTYEPDSIFRYQAMYSSVQITQINPSLGYDFGNGLSLGIGFDLQHMRAKLSNMVDYGAVCFGNVDPVTCSALGLFPQGHDGYAEIEGDGIGYGWNFGIHFEHEDTRLGIAYRTRVSHELEGDARFENVPAIFATQGLFQDGAIQADFTTPELFSLSIAKDFASTWTVAFDVTRTGWDTFRELRVRFDNPAQPDTVQPENWKDSYRYSLGVDWRMNDAWTFRVGTSLDMSPVTDDFRTARLPDHDRRWLALGATWRMSETMQLDAGYAHLFLDDSIPFDQTGSMQDRIVGTYEADADIFGVSLRYFFD